jgi:phosphoserine phosphatase RsbU/P
MAVEVEKVGGDFYEVFPLGGERAALFVGDVMGNGLAAAELTDIIRASARTVTLIEPSPAFILETVDRVLRGMDGEARVATALALVVIIDTKTGDLEIAGAGHPPAVLCADTCLFLEHPLGPPVGFAEGTYKSGALILEPGETLVL